MLFYTCLLTAPLLFSRILLHFLGHIKHPQPTSQRYLKAIAPRHHHHHHYHQQPGLTQPYSASKHQLTQFLNPFALLRRKIAVGRSVEVVKWLQLPLVLANFLALGCANNKCAAPPLHFLLTSCGLSRRPATLFRHNHLYLLGVCVFYYMCTHIFIHINTYIFVLS